MPAAEPTVMDMVLSELRAIRDSIHELRDSMNSQIGAHATQLATLNEWRDAQDAFTQENRRAIEEHKLALREAHGAVRALRWIGALAIAALGRSRRGCIGGIHDHREPRRSRTAAPGGGTVRPAAQTDPR
jgi:hypothetical protein